jgi:hypothetical protein
MSTVLENYLLIKEGWFLSKKKNPLAEHLLREKRLTGIDQQMVHPEAMQQLRRAGKAYRFIGVKPVGDHVVYQFLGPDGKTVYNAAHKLHPEMDLRAIGAEYGLGEKDFKALEGAAAPMSSGKVLRNLGIFGAGAGALYLGWRALKHKREQAQQIPPPGQDFGNNGPGNVQL